MKEEDNEVEKLREHCEDFGVLQGGLCRAMTDTSIPVAEQ